MKLKEAKSSVEIPQDIVCWLQKRADKSLHTLEAETAFLLGAIKSQLELNSTRFLGKGVIKRGG